MQSDDNHKHSSDLKQAHHEFVDILEQVTLSMFEDQRESRDTTAWLDAFRDYDNRINQNGIFLHTRNYRSVLDVHFKQIPIYQSRCFLTFVNDSPNYVEQRVKVAQENATKARESLRATRSVVCQALHTRGNAWERVRPEYERKVADRLQTQTSLNEALGERQWWYSGVGNTEDAGVLDVAMQAPPFKLTRRVTMTLHIRVRGRFVVKVLVPVFLHLSWESSTPRESPFFQGEKVCATTQVLEPDKNSIQYKQLLKLFQKIRRRIDFFGGPWTPDSDRKVDLRNVGVRRSRVANSRTTIRLAHAWAKYYNLYKTAKRKRESDDSGHQSLASRGNTTTTVLQNVLQPVMQYLNTTNMARVAAADRVSHTITQDAMQQRFEKLAKTFFSDMSYLIDNLHDAIDYYANGDASFLYTILYNEEEFPLAKVGKHIQFTIVDVQNTDIPIIPVGSSGHIGPRLVEVHLKFGDFSFKKTIHIDMVLYAADNDLIMDYVACLPPKTRNDLKTMLTTFRNTTQAFITDTTRNVLMDAWRANPASAEADYFSFMEDRAAAINEQMQMFDFFKPQGDSNAMNNNLNSLLIQADPLP